LVDVLADAGPDVWCPRGLELGAWGSVAAVQARFFRFLCFSNHCGDSGSRGTANLKRASRTQSSRMLESPSALFIDPTNQRGVRSPSQQDPRSSDSPCTRPVPIYRSGQTASRMVKVTRLLPLISVVARSARAANENTAGLDRAATVLAKLIPALRGIQTEIDSVDCIAVVLGFNERAALVGAPKDCKTVDGSYRVVELLSDWFAIGSDTAAALGSGRPPMATPIRRSSSLQYQGRV
jgi:hypothetical protein